MTDDHGVVGIGIAVGPATGFGIDRWRFRFGSLEVRKALPGLQHGFSSAFIGLDAHQALVSFFDGGRTRARGIHIAGWGGVTTAAFDVAIVAVAFFVDVAVVAVIVNGRGFAA